MMPLICLIAVISTALCIVLWFRDVRRIMKEQQSTVESARRQLVSSRARAAKARDDPDASAVLERSRNIYRQAVDHYNRTLRRPWVYPPAALMGFRMIQNGGERP